MTTNMDDTLPSPDPADLLGAAMSLRKACEDRAFQEKINLSEVYQGGEQFMRHCMTVATHFVKWADLNVNFDQTEDVWTYTLDEQFGEACVEESGIHDLTHFTDATCRAIAERMKLPLITPCYCVHTQSH